MKMVQITGIQRTSTPAVTSSTTKTPLMKRYGATFLRNLTTSGACHRRYSSAVGTYSPYEDGGDCAGYPGGAGAVSAPGRGAGAVLATAVPPLLVNAGMRPVSSATTTELADGKRLAGSFS